MGNQGCDCKACCTVLITLAVLFIGCGQHTSKPACSISPTNNDYGIAGEYGYQPYHDIDIARQCSKQTGRPIIIMFTGYSSLSMRGTDWEVLSDKKVKKIIDGNYILTVLYVDDKTRLAEGEQYFSERLAKKVLTLGDKNFDIQISHFNIGSVPLYVFVDSSMNKIAEPVGYVSMKGKYILAEHLKLGLRKITLPH